MKVLIAEDDPISRKLLQANLKAMSHEVIAAEDGSEATQMLSDHPEVRLAILDWMMPSRDGTEVCRDLKADIERPYTYVILLTAKTETDDLVRAFDVGADDYITKPFVADELKSRIRAGERVIELEDKLRTKISDLEETLALVKTLKGLVPICAWCKKIRDDADYWQDVEVYVQQHSAAEFSHSICPACLEKEFPEPADTKKA